MPRKAEVNLREEFFLRYAEVPPEERGVEAF
jgi:hypothetical protein